MIETPLIADDGDYYSELPGQTALFDLDAAQRNETRAAQHTRLAQLRKDNQRRIDELHGLGHRLNPASLALTRLDVLIHLLLDTDTKLRFDIAVEDQISRALDYTLTAARQAAEV